jgi:hypothetical protein
MTGLSLNNDLPMIVWRSELIYCVLLTQIASRCVDRGDELMKGMND